MKEIQETDEEIVRRVQNGDSDSFGVLVERYQEKMARYARKFLADNRDIEELVQEVFMKAYVNIRSFDAARTFSPWLYRIAHNEFVNALKRKRFQPFYFFDFGADTFFPHPVAPETSDREADERLLKKQLDESLGELDPKYREPLILSYYEELSYQEIADVLRIPAATVGVRLQRGREKLKKLYEQKYGTF